MVDRGPSKIRKRQGVIRHNWIRRPKKQIISSPYVTIVLLEIKDSLDKKDLLIHYLLEMFIMNEHKTDVEIWSQQYKGGNCE